MNRDRLEIRRVPAGTFAVYATICGKMVLLTNAAPNEAAACALMDEIGRLPAAARKQTIDDIVCQHAAEWRGAK
jgi:UDP-N-acetylglucosamine enolpyruvyl transferase